MEHSSDLVSLGKLLHETSYSKQKKEVLIDSKIGIDFIKKGNKIILHDIKKSKKMEKAHEYQLLYYIYYLKQKGIESEGIINYPLQRQIAEVKLTEDKEKEIVKIIEEIPKIMSLEKPPKPEKKRYCRKCSYFEFCWS